jgi:hypothetical protein
MQRTLTITGVMIVLAATAGLAVAMDTLPKLGALWSGTARRVKAFVGRPQRNPEAIEGPAAV